MLVNATVNTAGYFQSFLLILIVRNRSFVFAPMFLKTSKSYMIYISSATSGWNYPKSAKPTGECA